MIKHKIYKIYFLIFLESICLLTLPFYADSSTNKNNYFNISGNNKQLGHSLITRPNGYGAAFIQVGTAVGFDNNLGKDIQYFYTNWSMNFENKWYIHNKTSNWWDWATSNWDNDNMLTINLWEANPTTKETKKDIWLTLGFDSDVEIGCNSYRLFNVYIARGDQLPSPHNSVWAKFSLLTQRPWDGTYHAEYLWNENGIYWKGGDKTTLIWDFKN